MAIALGALESQLLAYAQMRHRQVVRSDEVARVLGIYATQTRGLFSRLARRQIIAKVRRGLYLLPPRIPPGGRWTASEFLALATLMEDRGATYQICGATTFHRYDWDEQVPNRIDVYNDAISGTRTIGSVSLRLIKVESRRLGDTDIVTTPEEVDAVYSSRARPTITQAGVPPACLQTISSSLIAAIVAAMGRT